MAVLKYLLVPLLCLTLVTLVIAQGSSVLSVNDPCWQTSCHSFATCKVINGSKAVCECPKNCTTDHKAVCGTNWKTYDNLCSLMSESCLNNDWNSVKYYGTCDAGDCRNSIWRNLICPFYSRCQLYRGLPHCACPNEQCPRKYEPVCATDGRTYPNMCHMRRAGCKMRKLLRVRNVGHCEPDRCVQQDCCCGAVCRLNQTNHASCVCDFSCSDLRNPVCGSDGITYNSPCALQLAACKQQSIKLMEVYSGECISGKMTTPSPSEKPIDPCLHQICQFHATCVSEQGLAKCICPNCPTTLAPVCGSDGVTYDNECMLRRASCVSMVTITVTRNSSCGVVQTTPSTGDPCSVGECAHYATCVVFRGVAKCVCPDLCPQVLSPLCGSDGLTYENDCALRRASCKSEKAIVMYHRGPCEVIPTMEPVKPTMDPCFDMICNYHGQCILDKGVPMCACPTNCPNTSTPVCGTDDKTYENECVMKQTSCNKQLTINLAHTGQCPSPCNNFNCCCGAVCKVMNNTPSCQCNFMCSAQYDPVCGSDGNTYDNECKLRLAACKASDPNLKVASLGFCPTIRPTTNPCSAGMCGFFSTCQVIQGNVQCVCPELCPGVFSPRCGSDGRMYQNECSMKRASCEQKKIITTMENTLCGQLVTQAPTSSANPCSSMNCHHFSTCKVIQGVAKCVCSEQCDVPKYPVCGSDGKTYESECALERRSCLSGVIISVVRIGVCLRRIPQVTLAATTSSTTTRGTLLVNTTPATTDQCASGMCAHHGVCEVHQNKPRCVCPSTCTTPKSPVCGTDGITYNSECELKKASCTLQKNIEVAKPGNCEPVGRCPTPKLCNKKCDHDICARSGKLCCCDGCAVVCTTKVWSIEARRYGCPSDPLGCRNDADCAAGLICCDTGCTKRCIVPRF